MGITVGLDEVGRGCWAGPLVAAAVAWPDDMVDPGMHDSKKLTKGRRTTLDVQIRERALSYGIGWVTPAEIDRYGMTKSVQLAMLRAMKRVQCAYDRIVIDGNINYFANVQGLHTDDIRAEVRADGSVAAVSAASIIAKVARDAYMADMAAQYAGYGFENHVGYGTPAHIAGLRRLGVSAIHRKSFRPIRDMITASGSVRNGNV